VSGDKPDSVRLPKEMCQSCVYAIHPERPAEAIGTSSPFVP